MVFQVELNSSNTIRIHIWFELGCPYGRYADAWALLACILVVLLRYAQVKVQQFGPQAALFACWHGFWLKD